MHPAVRTCHFPPHRRGPPPGSQPPGAAPPPPRGGGQQPRSPAALQAAEEPGQDAHLGRCTPVRMVSSSRAPEPGPRAQPGPVPPLPRTGARPAPWPFPRAWKLEIAFKMHSCFMEAANPIVLQFGYRRIETDARGRSGRKHHGLLTTCLSAADGLFSLIPCTSVKIFEANFCNARHYLLKTTN